MKTSMLALILSISSVFAGIAYAADSKTDSSKSVPVATCNDGKTMYGPNQAAHMGACRGHGGVASWADGSPVRTKGGTRTYKLSAALAQAHLCTSETSWAERTAYGWVAVCGDAYGNPVR